MPEQLLMTSLPMYNHWHIYCENPSLFRQLKEHQPGTQRHMVGPVRVITSEAATLCIVRSRHRVAKRLIGRRRSGRPVHYTKFTIHSTTYAVALASWNGGMRELASYTTLPAAIAALKNNSSAPHFPIDTATV